MKLLKCYSIFLLFILFPSFLSGQTAEREQELIKSMHSISSHTLFNYVEELASEKYGGRLTGTQGYRESAERLISLFKKWGVNPGGDNGTYLQSFPIPYTLVFKDCEVYMHIPYKDSSIKKFYKYEDEFIPGATSGSGEVTAEVIYVGYGITAPELGCDEYENVDVTGKILLMEREVPVSTRDEEVFKKWRPYSFHQYKLENAVKHGARGMLYNYGPISNPNNAYEKDFIYTHIGETAVNDIFSGTGKTHREIVNNIKNTLKPQSFNTGKVFTIKNSTEHHPEGVGYNVIGIIEGSDPVLKDEVIIIGGHLDHLGYCYEMMPGANDNASAVSVMLGMAEAMAKCEIKPKRTIMFLAFGAEEQAVVGSKYYLEHPKFPLEKTVAFLNMDGVGCGDRINALAAKNYPDFWEYIRIANEKYIHRIIRDSYFSNIARPRLDAARFMWENVPTISFSVSGATSFYHTSKDDIDTITPEILEDMAQLLFMVVMEMNETENLNFRN